MPLLTEAVFSDLSIKFGQAEHGKIKFILIKKIPSGWEKKTTIKKPDSKITTQVPEFTCLENIASLRMFFAYSQCHVTAPT
jgi:hypothetical protein